MSPSVGIGILLRTFSLRHVVLRHKKPYLIRESAMSFYSTPLLSGSP